MNFISTYPDGRSWDGDEGEDDEATLTDEELTALALADDPDQQVAPDAVPLALYPNLPTGSLPLSYMPPAMARVSGGWRIPLVLSVVVALVLIDALGLCITYGTLVAA